MKDNNIQTIYQKTIDFAAQKHGNQKMPNGLPYIVHLSHLGVDFRYSGVEGGTSFLRSGYSVRFVRD